MERPVFVMITLNSQKAIGPRYVVAACQAAGIESHLIHFKLFYSREVSRAKARELAEAGEQFVVRVHPRGHELVPYPRHATDEETGLLCDELKRIEPSIIGISFTSVDLAHAEFLTELFHQELPGVPVMWGGVHATLNPETCIQCADMVCVGEGDEVVVEYFAQPDRRDLPGMWFRDGGKITRNPVRPLIQDLDRLAFPMFGGNEIIIDDGRIQTDSRDPAYSISRHYQIVTARGCPFSCTYCLHSELRGLYKGQRYLRRRSVENVMRELEMRAGQGFFDAFISFFDEVFVKDPEWIQEFAPLYEKRIGLPFVGYSHAAYTTPEMLRELRRAGMISTTLAFQSGSERMLRDIYKRPAHLDKVVELAHTIHDEKLVDVLAYEGLTNTPFETEEDCRATFDFLLRLPAPYYLQMFELALFPGTRITSLPRLENPLSEETFRFWNLLYLLTQHAELPRDTIRALADDPFLRTHIPALEGLAFGLFPNDLAVWLIETYRQKTYGLQMARRAAQAPPPPLLRRVLRGVKRRALHLLDPAR
ncbi:MAG TPA: radical SAM protein [Candidatus Sumerlaeota bacterium]|nr:radical SAM protein [Candidatus Sumerlaeota bacterium]